MNFLSYIPYTAAYYAKGFADLILPRECIVCGKRLDIWEKHICTYCLEDLPLTYNWLLSRNRMSDNINSMINRYSEGQPPHTPYEPYCRGAALFFYNDSSGYRHIPLQIKYYGNSSAGKFFGRLLGNRLLSDPHFRSVDLIVPVPLHWTRRIRRGYNQAEYIAKGISETLEAGICPNLLTRNRRTKTQTVLGREGKMENVRSAFCVNRAAADKVKPQHILIVDDTFTTGATSCACHRAVRNHFKDRVKISIATLCFVG